MFLQRKATRKKHQLIISYDASPRGIQSHVFVQTIRYRNPTINYHSNLKILQRSSARPVFTLLHFSFLLFGQTCFVTLLSPSPVSKAI